MAARASIGDTQGTHAGALALPHARAQGRRSTGLLLPHVVSYTSASDASLACQ